MDGSKGIKVILLGESGVGKTNLINVSMGKEFDPNINSSLSTSFCDSQLEYDNKNYIYSLWDTAGQERFRSLNGIFIKGAKIVLIVFAIDNKNSFEQIDFWVNYAKDTLENEKYILALIGNKYDLFEEQTITDEEISQKVKELNIQYKMTSAYTDADGFKEFLHGLIKEYINLVGPDNSEELYFTLKKQIQEKPKKGFKC